MSCEARPERDREGTCLGIQSLRLYEVTHVTERIQRLLMVVTPPPQLQVLVISSSALARATAQAGSSPAIPEKASMPGKLVVQTKDPTAELNIP